MWKNLDKRFDRKSRGMLSRYFMPIFSPQAGKILDQRMTLVRGAHSGGCGFYSVNKITRRAA